MKNIKNTGKWIKKPKKLEKINFLCRQNQKNVV